MSTVFRVEKTTNYTVMSNIHLKDRRLTYKAKGLMSEMLSLPPDWDYTLAGLAVISNDGVDSVRSAVRELERYGYLARSQKRDRLGRMSVNEFVVYEDPSKNPHYTPDEKSNGGSDIENSIENTSNGSVKAKSPSLENPTTVKNIVENHVENSEISVEKQLFFGDPLSEKPSADLPLSENPTTATFNKLNNQVLNTHQSNHSVSRAPREERIDRNDRSDFSKAKKFLGDERANYREIIREHIEYDYFVANKNNRFLKIDLPKIDELIEIMVDVICSNRETVRVNGEDMPQEVVKKRFLELNQEHIEYVVDALKANTSAVRNIRAYLICFKEDFFMYNKITLMGKIVANPELRATKDGVPVTSFSVSVDRRYKKKGEKRKSDFFNIVCWRGNAEFVCKHFRKGDMILVEGEMQTHRPEVKDGEKSYTWYEVLADYVSFTTRYSDSNAAPVFAEIGDITEK